MNALSSLAFPSYFQGVVFWCFVSFTIWFKLASLCHLDVSSSTEQDSGFILRRAFENPNLCFAGFFCWSNRTDQMRPHIRRVAVAEEQGTRDGKSVGSRIFREPKPGAGFDYMSIFEPFPVFSSFGARLELQAKDSHWKVQSSELKINKEMLGEVNESLSGIPRKSGK